MANTWLDVEKSEIEKNLKNISLEDIHNRHRRERKDLQAKIQALKKSAPKSDKKKRKEVMEEVARLEKELDKKQADEIVEYEEFNNKLMENLHESPSINNDENEEQTQVRVSKAQRRRNKKAKEARERENRLQADLEEYSNGPKIVESRKLEDKLEKRKLALYHILSDGDCLYNAVKHQLAQHGFGYFTVEQLRSKTANYIQKHKRALLPYMTHPDSNGLLTDEEFLKYCDDVRNTTVWGGQVELKALSSTLQVPIEVIQAEGSPTIQGTEFEATPLVITYHRHMYSMGEHYNSTIPISQMPTVAELD